MCVQNGKQNICSVIARDLALKDNTKKGNNDNDVGYPFSQYNVLTNGALKRENIIAGKCTTLKDASMKTCCSLFFFIQ